MPYASIQILKGATREQKAALVKDVTDSFVRVLGKLPEHIHVVIQEIEEEDWGYRLCRVDAEFTWTGQSSTSYETAVNILEVLA